MFEKIQKVQITALYRAGTYHMLIIEKPGWFKKLFGLKGKRSAYVGDGLNWREAHNCKKPSTLKESYLCRVFHHFKETGSVL